MGEPPIKKFEGSQLSKVYEPKNIERQATEIWFTGRYFHADPLPKTKNSKLKTQNYTIVIPPPNVTAPLHLGHALNNTLQDILIRYHRMRQYNTLWMPGTDHAGIATQTVVEKRIISEEGKRRTDFTRDEFVARIQTWKDEYEATIISQLKAMGCSCDWDRTRFTMDEVCAKAVRAAFFKLFKDGLIYRGKQLVNWDPATQTVLADDEVEHQPVQGHFWYLRYPLIEPVEISDLRLPIANCKSKIENRKSKIDFVTVATTRPETMLGDTAVAMNPADPRAKHLVGKKIRLPIVGRIIPIIADEHVILPDPNSEDEKARFSTGFLKVTPAHDPDDWEIGQRHGLEIINVMAPDGSISDKCGWNDANSPEAQALLGMDRFEAREAIVEWFRQENLLEDVRDYTHEIGHSYRSHVPIEPYLSDQWYIAVKEPIDHLAEKCGDGLIEGTDIPVNSLAGLALKPLLDGRLRFIPERYAKTYQTWLENLRDWPISRQLWWGHRIPVWYAKVSHAMYVHVGESDDSVENRRKQETEQLLMSYLDACGISRDDVAFLWSRELIDGSFPLYICVKNPKGELALSMANKILAHNSTTDINLIRQYKAENEAIKDEFGLKAYQDADKLRPRIQSMELDNDVLDTWFSSALWPFSTMGWPDDTPDLKAFYPGDVLCTAREIITLWVSRMVMMGQYCAGDIPFSDVYIHAMIQDGEGRKMSKSLGNGIDPLVAINSHGADAMRFTLASMTTETQDIRMPVVLMTLPDGRQANTSPKFDIGRNFCNKLWNASRFALMNLEGLDPDGFDPKKMDITDKWILSRLAKTITETSKSLDDYKFSEPLAQLYKFFWNNYCDWYLEWIKPRMQDGEQRPIAQNVLAFILDQTLRLLHPFVPFITEGIFQKLNEIAPVRKLEGIAQAKESDALVIAQWPIELNTLIDENSEQQIYTIQDPIRAIRDIKNTYNIAPKAVLIASAKASEPATKILNDNADLVCKLAGVKRFQAGPDVVKPQNAAAAIVNDIQIFVHDVINPEAERTRFQKQRQQVETAQKAIEAKLSNENFVNKAKPEVVAQAKEKLIELTELIKTIDKHLSELSS